MVSYYLKPHFVFLLLSTLFFTNAVIILQLNACLKNLLIKFHQFVNEFLNRIVAICISILYCNLSLGNPCDEEPFQNKSGLIFVFTF